jgi:NADH-quinone oxidoreductase subunit H
MLASRTSPMRTRDSLAVVGPVVVIAAAATTAVCVPFGPMLSTASGDITTLYALAVALRMLAAFFALAHRSTARPSVFDGVRATVRSALCGLPAVLAIAGLVLLSGTASVQGLIDSQGALPWEWNLFRTPFTLGLGALYAVSVLASAPEPRALRSMRNEDEQVGRVDRVLTMTSTGLEWAHVAVLCAIGAALFVGGWRVPGASTQDQGRSAILQMVGIGVLSAKAWSAMFVLLALRWVMPRARPAAVIAQCWRAVALLALITSISLAGWTYYVPRLPDLARLALAITTFAFCGLWAAPSALRRIVALRRGRGGLGVAAPG